MAEEQFGDGCPAEKGESMFGLLDQSRSTHCLDAIFTQGGKNNHLIPASCPRRGGL